MRNINRESFWDFPVSSCCAFSEFFFRWIKMRRQLPAVGLVPRVILFTFQYGGQIDVCWATCFVLVLTFHLHFSHTHVLRGWSVKTASQCELCQTYTRLVRQMKCVMFNHKFMYKFSLHRKYWAWNGRSHLRV